MIVHLLKGDYRLFVMGENYHNGNIIGHYPATGNDNTRSGGFYLQEEIREVVSYAAKR